MVKRIVIALGGNALQENPKDLSPEAQIKTAKKTASSIVDFIEEGYEIVIVHGNGPQVGQIISVYEKAKDIPNMPFPECGAMSQGYIGYHLQKSIGDEIRKRAIDREVITMITQVLVNKNDPAFNNPSKPVGSFFSKEEAKKLEKTNNYIMKEDAGRGWRRVVSSPEPIDIIESKTLKSLVESNFIVITAGGGGIPVVKRESGELEGVSAVIDKDLAAELVGEKIDADVLVILTAVEKVYIDFQKTTEKALDIISVKEAEKYIKEGQFAPGSMLPKIKAAIKFAKSKKGRKAIITSLDKISECMKGGVGTKIEYNNI